MLVRHEHLPVRDVGEAVHLEEEEQALRGVLLELGPLVVREAARLVDDVGVDA